MTSPSLKPSEPGLKRDASRRAACDIQAQTGRQIPPTAGQGCRWGQAAAQTPARLPPPAHPPAGRVSSAPSSSRKLARFRRQAKKSRPPEKPLRDSAAHQPPRCREEAEAGQAGQAGGGPAARGQVGEPPPRLGLGEGGRPPPHAGREGTRLGRARPGLLVAAAGPPPCPPRPAEAAEPGAGPGPSPSSTEVAGEAQPGPSAGCGRCGSVPGRAAPLAGQEPPASPAPSSPLAGGRGAAGGAGRVSGAAGRSGRLPRGRRWPGMAEGRGQPRRAAGQRATGSGRSSQQDGQSCRRAGPALLRGQGPVRGAAPAEGWPRPPPLLPGTPGRGGDASLFFLRKGQSGVVKLQVVIRAVKAVLCWRSCR